MRADGRKSRPRFGEFVAGMALTVSLAALSIDSMLPALPFIGADLGVTGENRPQLIIPAVFLGLALGQIVYGPLSDSTGRKPANYAGFVLFIAGSLLCALADRFGVMPLGHIAGVAASVVGSLTTFLSLLLGTLIGQAYDGTVLPLVGSLPFSARRRLRSNTGPRKVSASGRRAPRRGRCAGCSSIPACRTESRR